MNLRNLLCKTSMRQANVRLSTGSPDLFFLNSFHSHIYLGLCWVLTAAQALLQLWRGASHRSGFSCGGPLALGAQVSAVEAPERWSASSVAVAHGLGGSVACGTFVDQGLNP